MDCAWKPNWDETKEHFRAWWRHDGLVLGMWGAPPAGTPQVIVEDPGPPRSLEQRYLDVQWRARANHYALSRSSYPADCLPEADCDLGAGVLALMLGAEPRFAPETIWFTPSMMDDDPEGYPPLRFNPDNRWWQLTEATINACQALGRGKYAVECLDLVENMDILAALRDPQCVLMDMLERPEWVHAKLAEINAAWFAAYGKIYELIKLEDASSVYGAFRLWGPGKTAKVQCDCSAMFSPAMFEEFVVPSLTAQCAWLDHSMYHLDGHQCLPHLDLLLGIDALDAIEWTPDPTVPGGGDPVWFPMYRRILDAGKSVQVLNVAPAQIVPLLDAIGGKGVYVMTFFANEQEANALVELTAGYR